MKRIGSQLCFCSPELILRRTVVEQNEENTVTRIFSLDDGIVEPANTLFFDGILSAEIVSLKESTSNNITDRLIENYHYIDITKEPTTQTISINPKPLLLDFGTSSPLKINHLLTQLTPILTNYSIFEIIAACTFYPSLATNLIGELSENRTTKLLLWENVDLVKKMITEKTSVREIK